MKGFFDYLRLADMLGDKYQMVMVGVSKEQKKKLPSNIIGIERTNSVEELIEMYSAADLFLNLSYCENYPTVNIEAIACGTPVLTYDVGGSSETLVQGMGYAVSKGSVQSVANAIKANSIEKRQVPRDIIKLNDRNYSTQSYLAKYAI